jgi:regulator of sigma E protease
MTHIVLYLLAFLVAFLLLVTVHEFGHFWVARRLGFKVLRFSIGMGNRPLWKRTGTDGVEYWISPIPIGGYVKMADEREGPVAPDDLPRSFTRRPHWQRLLVLLAGPGFNILFAVLVLCGLLFASGITQVRPVLGSIDPHSLAGQAGLMAGDEITAINARPVNGQSDVELDLLDAVSAGSTIRISVRTPAGLTRIAQLRIPSARERLRLTEPSLLGPGLGLQFYRPPAPPVIASVLPNQPAARAGLAAGDHILAIDGQTVSSQPELQQLVRAHPGQPISVRYRRGSVVGTVEVTPVAQQLDGRRVGVMGVEVQPGYAPMPPAMLRHVKLSLPAAFARANVEAWNVTALQGRMIWRMLIDKVSLKNLSGPLSIAEYAGDAAAEGLPSFLQFLVLLSLALGFMNLLPIPILDGGQIVFQTIEWLKGSPLSERFQLVSQQLGLALLFLLMGVALFNDISPIG